jgi:hypothetical protein
MVGELIFPRLLDASLKAMMINSFMIRLTRSLLSLFSVMVLTGCVQAREIPAADEILANAASRMSSLKGFEFLIERSGEPVFLNPEQNIAFRLAQGQYMAPDRVSANVRVIAPGLVTDVQIISIDEQQWETNYLSGVWYRIDIRYSFNPLRLFDPDNGIAAILRSDLYDLSFVGLEELTEIPGKALYVIDAVVQGDRPSIMTYGMIDPVPLQSKIWIDPETYYVYRILIIDPANTVDQEDTIWKIDFWNFNTTFDIQPPLID